MRKYKGRDQVHSDRLRKIFAYDPEITNKQLKERGFAMVLIKKIREETNTPEPDSRLLSIYYSGDADVGKWREFLADKDISDYRSVWNSWPTLGEKTTENQGENE